MKTAKAETMTETTQTAEMTKLYHALAISQANIFLYLKKATDEEDLKRRATEIVGSLETIIVKYEEPEAYKCGDGTVYNPVTGRCE